MVQIIVMIVSFSLRKHRNCTGISKLLNMSKNESSGNFSVDIKSMRIKYNRKNDTFTESDLVSKEPISQFKNWFEVACVTPGILEANAMCLCTCTRDGRPSGRYVLLKEYGIEGFKFFTNYSSRKGSELSENPRAALVFYWEPLKRSVRIEGNVKKIPVMESDEYFHSRPKDSQIGAACSEQSNVIGSREVLTNREKELKMKYSKDIDVVPRPESWGGYLVVPHTIEFWQGQSDRLHDRIRFRRQKDDDNVDGILLHEGENGWVYERLSP